MGLKEIVQKTAVLGCAAMLMTAGSVQAGPGGAPIDCSILLCMGSGFPNDGEGICSAAKAEVVRRVTPNPHSEPPLQIWNCPLGASYAPPSIGGNRVQPLTAVVASRRQMKTDNAKLWLANISAANHEEIYKFLLSIKVYNIMHYRYSESGHRGDCEQRFNMQLGEYAQNGEYVWNTLHPFNVPDWVGLGRTCHPPSRFRGVAIEWTDYMGKNETEVIQY